MKNIDIIRQGANGEGVGVSDEKIVFIPYALCGENVDAKVVEESTHFEVAQLEKINKASLSRVEPVCPYFKVCGGCDIMHASTSEQKVIKQQIVQNNLKKYANYNGKIQSLVVGDNLLNYRNHITFQVSENGTLGFYEKDSHKFLEIKECKLANNVINNSISFINSYFFDNKLKGYNYKTKKGEIKQVDLKFVNDCLLITFVGVVKELPNIDNLFVRLNCLNVRYGIYISYNDKNSTIYGELKHISGIKEIEYIDQGIKCFVSPFSFMQINAEIKDKIYNKIYELVNGDIIVDAYCGRGVLSCKLAKKVQKVYGIEIVSSAIFDAKQIAQNNNIKNIEFLCGDIKDMLQDIKIIDSIILDPPRKGCEKQVLETILKKLPKQIIYLSCASNTLARDLKILSENYDIKFVEPYDMFPQTKHIETLCLLEKK